MRSFDYKKQISPIFGEIFRPLIDVEIFSEIENDWIEIRDVLADTGADISILPRSVGEVILHDVTKGRVEEIKGIVPFARLTVFIHELRLRIDKKEFKLPVAIADSFDVPPILGRVKGLDLFSVEFERGKRVNISL